MEVETSVARGVQATGDMAHYDAACKRVLSERQVLAYILHDFMREYESLSREQIANEFLEGEPLIGEEPVERDDVGRVRLGDPGDATLFENTVTFDIRVDALLPGGAGSARLEIDLEAQNDQPRKYPLLKRAVYYCGRMLSKQGGVDVVRSRYDRVRKVVSIWVCSDADKAHQGTVARFCLDQHDLVGRPNYKHADYDLVEVILICLGGREAHGGALGMLGLLFDCDIPAREKIRRLKHDFGIITSEEFEGKVDDMCNLSLGVYEKGRRKGITEGRAEAIRSIMRLHGMTLADVLDFMGIPKAELPHYEALLAAQPA